MAAVLTRRAKNRLRTERHLALQFNNWEHPMSLFRSDDSRDRRKSNRYDLQYLAQIDPGDGSALLSCVISDISIAAAKLTVGTQGVPEEFTLWFPAASPRGTAHRRPRRGSIRAGKFNSCREAEPSAAVHATHFRAKKPDPRQSSRAPYYLQFSTRQPLPKHEKVRPAGQSGNGGGARAPEVQPEGICVVPRTTFCSTSPQSSSRS
jgi:hypothetical protein